MILGDWREVQAATRYQRGAVMRECDRLGLGDRAERLAVCARLLGLDALGSTRDLTTGQAGQLARVLGACRDRAGLPGVAAVAACAEDQAGAGTASGRVTAAEVIMRVSAALSAALGSMPAAGLAEPDPTDPTEGQP